MPKRLAIIGAGPKAAAIAAKAAVLRRLDRADIHVSVFEAHQPGANWSGAFGYTDGRQRLCTAAERDLGFPYDGGLFDPDVAQRMYSDFSWGTFLVTEPQNGDGPSAFSDWINRGRLPPTHREFARYIDWALGRSGATIERGEVVGVEPHPSGQGWQVRQRRGRGQARVGPFDGVVATGPGPANGRLIAGISEPRVTDGVRFWTNPFAFAELAGDSEDPIVIVGAGGTAAAIAAWFVRMGSPRTLMIVGDQAALFTRSDGFFESQIFSDDAVWQRLELSVRSEFTRRLNRGVVWATVSDELARSAKVRFEPGRVEQIELDQQGELRIRYRNGEGPRDSPASLIVDASGFDGWWFRTLLPASLRARMEDADPDAQHAKREGLLGAMGKDFALLSEEYGKFHAPVLSQGVGPGFSTLMVLGSLSDRILRAYR